MACLHGIIFGQGWSNLGGILCVTLQEAALNSGDGEGPWS